MAETSSLLNCRTGNRTGGSNPPASAPFCKWRFRLAARTHASHAWNTGSIPVGATNRLVNTNLFFFLSPKKDPVSSEYSSVVRNPMHAVALANTPACNSHRTSMRWPLHPIAFFRAVVLHLPSQYIFISLCSISALPLAVLLLWDSDSLTSAFPFS